VRDRSHIHYQETTAWWEDFSASIIHSHPSVHSFKLHSVATHHNTATRHQHSHIHKPHIKQQTAQTQLQFVISLPLHISTHRSCRPLSNGEGTSLDPLPHHTIMTTTQSPNVSMDHSREQLLLRENSVITISPVAWSRKAGMVCEVCLFSYH
jgi:hypothetical protein